MDDIGRAFKIALALLLSGDRDLYEVVARSLVVSVSAVVIALTIGLPLGAFLAVTRFPGRKVLVAVLNALMGLPPVVVGLVSISYCRARAPSGAWDSCFRRAQ